MVRKCIVPNCKSADNKILCHRFPTKEELAFKWLAHLEIDASNYTKNDLKKYVVCTMHFDKKDYKNEQTNGLNTTAFPKLYGHEPRANYLEMSQATNENINSISTYEISIIKNKSNEDLQEKNDYPFDEIECYGVIHYDLNQISETNQKPSVINLKNDDNAMETSVIECTESEISRLDDVFELQDSCPTTTEEYLLSSDDIIGTDNCINQCIQQYESDVEIIDYNEAIENDMVDNEIDIKPPLEKYEHCKDGCLSETVSLISSIAEGDEEEISNDIEKTFVDVACQSDPVQINNVCEIEDEEFRNKSRKDLIDLIKQQKQKIIEVDKKLREFQATHIKLVQSMDAFKIL